MGPLEIIVAIQFIICDGTAVWSEPPESWVGFKEDALDEEDESLYVEDESPYAAANCHDVLFHRPFMISDTMSQKIEEAGDSKVWILFLTANQIMIYQHLWYLTYTTVKINKVSVTTNQAIPNFRDNVIYHHLNNKKSIKPIV